MNITRIISLLGAQYYQHEIYIIISSRRLVGNRPACCYRKVA